MENQPPHDQSGEVEGNGDNELERFNHLAKGLFSVSRPELENQTKIAKEAKALRIEKSPKV